MSAAAILEKPSCHLSHQSIQETTQATRFKFCEYINVNNDQEASKISCPVCQELEEDKGLLALVLIGISIAGGVPSLRNRNCTIQ